MHLSEIRHAAAAGSRTALIVERLVLRLDSYLSACQLGITLASLGLGWVGEPLVARSLDPVFKALEIAPDNVHYFSFPIAFFIITFLHITAGEQAPKILAIRKYQPTAQAIGYPLFLFFNLFRPLIWLLNESSNLMLRAIGIDVEDSHGEAPTEEQLRLLLGDSHAAGALTRRERLIMENVLDLEEKTARRYMLPRNQIVYINQNDPMEVRLQKAAASGHTRLPLCEDDLDHIIGIVHLKDVFQAMVAENELTALAHLARAPLYVPETISLDALLRHFQRKGTVLALLVDEYGMLSGMITLENVIEELVGPIQDEFDAEEPMIARRGLDRYELDALCPLVEAVDKLGLSIPAVDVDTVGGLVTNVIGHIPKVGERAVVGDHEITVLEAESRRATRLLLTRRPAAGKRTPNQDET